MSSSKLKALLTVYQHLLLLVLWKRCRFLS